MTELELKNWRKELKSYKLKSDNMLSLTEELEKCSKESSEESVTQVYGIWCDVKEKNGKEIYDWVYDTFMDLTRHFQSRSELLQDIESNAYLHDSFSSEVYFEIKEEVEELKKLIEGNLNLLLVFERRIEY